MISALIDMETRPTIRRRQLGAALRRLREAAGLSREQAAKVIQCTPKISRVESGHQGIKPLELGLLLDAFGIAEADPQRERLLVLAKRARKRDWWSSQYGDLLATGDYADYLSLESDAAFLRTYQSELVPGLLQTPDYARAVIGRWQWTEDELDALVEVRMARQEILRRADRPVKLWAVLNEGVLRRVVGGPETMKAQLRRLVEVAHELPATVTIQVLPYAAGAHAAIDGPFVLVGFPEEGATDAVWLEGLARSVYLEGAADVERYVLAFTHVTAVALPPEESLGLIAKVAKELQ